MEFDLGTTLIGLIAVAICASPFVIDYRRRKKKEKLLYQSLLKIAQQHQGKIGQHEYCGDFLLATDENVTKVFFVKENKDTAISQFVNLSEVRQFQVIKKTRVVKNDKASAAVIEKVELCFTPKSQNNSETRFELYDEEINTQLTGELQFADRWTKIIKNRIGKG